MTKGTFPTLLTKKATMMGGLTRFDLAILGASYLILSWTKVSGLWAVIINLILLILVKTSQKFFMVGFFKFLHGENRLEWSKSWEEKHE